MTAVQKTRDFFKNNVYEKIVIALLTVIIGGLSYFILDIKQMQRDAMKDRIEMQKDDKFLEWKQNYLSETVAADPDTPPERKAMLLEFARPHRGGVIQ